MAFTKLQLDICRIISNRLRESGEAYVAGGVALNKILDAPRISRDIDLFHDTTQAVENSWSQDNSLLQAAHFTLVPLRDAPGFKEALVRKGEEEVLVQWTRDSSFRFFPLVTDSVLGLTLHPFDLATNKVLALVGRLEPRDWIDVLEVHDKIQPLGYLAWAACAKDPGFSPASIIAESRRSGRYSQVELNELSFAGVTPDAHKAGKRWHKIIRESETIIKSLVGCAIGTCVLGPHGRLCRLPARDIPDALENNQLTFHAGSIKGTYPKISVAPECS